MTNLIDRFDNLMNKHEALHSEFRVLKLEKKPNKMKKNNNKKVPITYLGISEERSLKSTHYTPQFPTMFLRKKFVMPSL